MKDETVIALGFFDGVHLAHRALLDTARARAEARGAVAAAFTFDRSPRECVTGETVPLLTTTEERCDLLRREGRMARVIVAQFDEALRTLKWEAFLDRLREEEHAVHFVAGHDYRFGYRGEGTPERLAAYCARHGLGCDIIPCVLRGGEAVSSSRIRALLASGDASGAAALLGRPYALCGTVTHGQGLGHRALVPTANLALQPCKLLPRRGVYAARATLSDGSQYAAVTNIGVRPTVESGGETTVETYLADFSGDLYGGALRVELLAFLREEQQFGDLAALRQQIELDACAAKKSVGLF